MDSQIWKVLDGLLRFWEVLEVLYVLSRYARSHHETTSQAGEPRKTLDSDTPQNLKTLEINGAHDEMHNPFRPHIAAITNISVVDRYSTVTRPLHVGYVGYTP